MKNFLARQWFLLALVIVLAIGFLGGRVFSAAADRFPVWALVATVLFLMAWSLDSTAIWRAVRHPQAAILGVLVNFLVVPLCAWLASRALQAPLSDGLLFTAAVPCTLASAAVWTRRAGGNDAAALVVTMVTNFSCFLVTPLLIWLATGIDARESERLDPLQMMFNLLLVAVLPMVIGQLLRIPRPLGRWASQNKSLLSTIAQVGILTMVLIAAVKASTAIGNADADSQLGPATWTALIVAVVVVHGSALYIGFGIGRLFKLDRGDWIAVGIAGSQKTLMIGVYLAVEEGLGLGILAMVAYHAVQLLIDTLIADRLSQRAPL